MCVGVGSKLDEELQPAKSAPKSNVPYLIKGRVG
ncbi:hypothetical protein A1S_3739 [Acinetobacter baumannii ATCC 17978]|nr:hypothetical protein A1S_3739 [Acinetobacter baumannii ATCC 17978]